MGNNKLTGGVDRVGGKVERSGMKVMPSRQRRVGFPGTNGVEGELDVGEQVRPAIRWEGDMTGG